MRLGDLIPILLASSVAIAPSALFAQQSPLSLRQAWELTQEHDPALKASRQAVEEGEGGRIAAISPFLPRVGAAAEVRRFAKDEGFVWNSGALGLGSINFPSTQKTVPTYSAGVEQLLFDSGKSIAQYRQAREGVEAARQEEAAAVQGRAVELVRAFSSLYLAQRRQEVAAAAHTALAEHERVARALYASQQVPQGDVLAAEVAASRARLEVTEARDEAATAARQLSAFIGREPGEVKTPEVPSPPRPAASAAGERPELRAKEAQARAARHEAAKEGLSYLPEFYARAEAAYIDDDFRIHKDQFTFLGGVRWPIFDGRQHWGQRRIALARSERARWERQAMEEAFGVELEDAQRAWERSGEEIAVASRNRERASKNLADVRAHYGEGMASALDVRDAVRLWTEAAFGYHEALCKRQFAAARIRQAAGIAVLGEGEGEGEGEER